MRCSEKHKEMPSNDKHVNIPMQTHLQHIITIKPSIIAMKYRDIVDESHRLRA